MDPAPALLDHWWPRPGWRPGRITLLWQLGFGVTPAVAEHARAYQQAVRDRPALDPIPPEWLHLTVQLVGYTDEVTAVPDVVDAVSARVAPLPRFDLTLDRPVVSGEAIVFPARPEEPVRALLDAVRAGIGDALGAAAVRTSPEQSRGFLPHVSIAYSRAAGDAAPVVAALAGVDRRPVTVPVPEVTLVRQERLLAPHWLYRWTVEAAAPLS